MSDQNTIDSAEARRVVGEIESMLAELLSLRGTYMAECKQVRERIKGAKEDAVEAGIPRKALNLELKRRDFERRIEALIHDADEDDAALADQIRKALGDFASLPLGMAALGESGEEPEKPAKRTRKARGAAPADKSAALDEIAADDGDVRPAFLRERDLVAEAKSELDARIAENAERLEGGIRKLDA
jgi:hypothetical protein